MIHIAIIVVVVIAAHALLLFGAHPAEWGGSDEGK